jgi:hypothetical protein
MKYRKEIIGDDESRIKVLWVDMHQQFNATEAFFLPRSIIKSVNRTAVTFASCLPAVSESVTEPVSIVIFVSKWSKSNMFVRGVT